jgi:hypothetical protein
MAGRVGDEFDDMQALAVPLCAEGAPGTAPGIDSERQGGDLVAGAAELGGRAPITLKTNPLSFCPIQR